MRRLLAVGLVVLGALGATACESSSVAVRERRPCSGADCLVVRRGQDIEIGSLLWIRTQETETGIDSQRGVELAIEITVELTGRLAAPGAVQRTVELTVQAMGTSAPGQHGR